MVFLNILASSYDIALYDMSYDEYLVILSVKISKSTASSPLTDASIKKCF